MFAPCVDTRELESNGGPTLDAKLDTRVNKENIARIALLSLFPSDISGAQLKKYSVQEFEGQKDDALRNKELRWKECRPRCWLGSKLLDSLLKAASLL